MRNKSPFFAGLPVALLVAALAAPVFAQTQSGAIDGIVRDATGQVLPGVSVTLEGETLITSEVTTTNDQGIYRFRNLPPGVYTLRFELSGFKTLNREGVIVDVGRTTQINVTLELATVAETVTVIGESPMVDVKSTVIGTNFDEQVLQDVPSARDVWSLLEHQAPGITTNRLDVGGSETGLQAVFSARGSSWQQNSYYLNGVNVTCPAALGASGYYYDFDSFEEIQVETGSHPASVNAPGVFLNMVTKTGGNEFKGGGAFYYQEDGTQSDNFTDELEARGASPSAFDFLSDANAQLGGPIVRDRSTFYFSWRDERVHRFVPGFPPGCDPDDPSTCKTENTDMWQYVIRNSTQLNERNRVSGEWHHMSYFKPNRGAAGNRPPEATWIEDDTFDIIQGDWSSTLSQNALLDVRFSHLRVWFPTFQQPDVKGQAAQDVVTGMFFNARDFNTERLRRRFTYKADLTYFAEQWGASNHEFKFGFEFSHNTVRNETTAIDDVFLLFANGVADRVIFRNTPLVSREALNQTSAYADDVITVGERLTIKLGLRFDRYHGFLPEQNSPPGTFVGARSFPERTGLLEVQSFAPRVGVIIGLEEGGKSALKASWGRYYHQFSTGFVNFANQNGVLSDTYEWTDLNGDGQFQLGEQGRLLASQIAANNLIDPDLEHPYTDEFTIGVEKELTADVSVSATFSRRTGNRLTDSVDIGVPFSAYTPLTVTDPGPDNVLGTADDGGAITVFNQDPATLGQNQLMLTNPGEVTLPDGQRVKNDSEYNGVEITVQKRMSHDWQMMVSYTYNDTEQITRGSQFEFDSNNNYFANPNLLVNARGKSFYDRTHQFKLLGTWITPGDWRVSGIIRAQSGGVLGRTFTVTGLNQGTESILAEPVGSQRLPNVATADISIAKIFSAGRARVEPRVDIFNITNANTVTDVITNSGPAYNRVLNFLSPRIFRFGVKVSF